MLGEASVSETGHKGWKGTNSPEPTARGGGGWLGGMMGSAHSLTVPQQKGLHPGLAGERGARGCVGGQRERLVLQGAGGKPWELCQ